MRLALCPGMRYLGRGNGSWQSFHSWLIIVFGASLNGEKVRQENIEGRSGAGVFRMIPDWFGASTGNDDGGRRLVAVRHRRGGQGGSYLS